MKKLKNLLIIPLLALVLCFGAVMQTACGKTGGSRLSIEGQKEVFYIGDEFTTGEDFKAYLVDSDGTRTDVTANAEVKPEKSLNMDEVGQYAVTVSYQDKKEVYFISVYGYDNALIRLSADTQHAKLSYKIGEKISFDGVKIIGTYENGQKKLFDDEIDIGDVKTTVTSPSGGAHEGVFIAEGEYTVSFSKGTIKTSYKVKVEGADLSTVDKALSIGAALNGNVVSGEGSVTEKGLSLETSDFEYLFGDNYTRLKVDKNEYHLGMVSGRLNIVYLENGKQAANAPEKSESLMNGMYFTPWRNDVNKKAYGIEALIGDIYSIASTNPNKDFTETADEISLTYGFSFGYLYPDEINRPYYFETEVSFTLGDSYFIETASVLQKAWFSSTTTTPPYSNWETIDGVTGPTTDEPDYTWEVTLTQKSGKRTEKNPYANGGSQTSAGVVQSYQIFFGDQEIKNGDTVYVNRGEANGSGHSTQYTLTFKNIQPADANFTTDILYVTDGTLPKEASLMFWGLDVHVLSGSGNNVVNIEFQRGGEMQLTFTTKQTETVIFFKVVGSSPKTLTPRIFNSSSGLEYTASQITVGVGDTIYFTCIPDESANGVFTARVVNPKGITNNSSGFTLTAPTEDVSYWCFTPKMAGTCELRMTSSVNSQIMCSIAVTVVQKDFAGVLNGSYTVTDTDGGEYSFLFVPEAEGGVGGQVTVSYIKDNDTTEAVYDYSVDGGKIVLELASGTELGVSLSVSVDNELILTDRYSNHYKATANQQ